jgi:hypothetical protein
MRECQSVGGHEAEQDGLPGDLFLPSPCCHCSVVAAYLRSDPCFLHAAQHTLCALQHKKRRQEKLGGDKLEE